jgi:hypothetical protein
MASSAWISKAAPLSSVDQPKEQVGETERMLPVESDRFFDALRVDSEKSAEETLGVPVALVSPEYGSDVKGDTVVRLAAPGFKSVTEKCWKQGDRFGSDSLVGTIALLLPSSDPVRSGRARQQVLRKVQSDWGAAAAPADLEGRRTMNYGTFGCRSARSNSI